MNKVMKYAFIALFIVAGVTAREYNDPSKKSKKRLLEEGEEQTKQVVEASATETKDAAPASSEITPLKGEAQYCACVNLHKVLDLKYEMTMKLIRDDVIEDKDWSIRNKLRENANNAEAAVKKAAYNNSLDRAEVICDAIKLNYKKVSDMRGDIEMYQTQCNLVDIK